MLVFFMVSNEPGFSESSFVNAVLYIAAFNRI